MRRKISIIKQVDKVTIGLFLIILIMGWLNIYAAVYNEEQTGLFNLSQLYGKQFIWIITAVIISIVVLSIDNKMFFYFSWIIYGMSIFLLFFVLLFGKEVSGAKSWFEIGPFSLQPSEFAKFATALALANYLNSSHSKLTDIKSFVTASLIIIAPAALIMLQPDMGSTVVFGSFFIVLLREGMSPIIFFAGLMVVILFLLTLLVNNIYIELGLVILTMVIIWFMSKKSKNYFTGLGIIFGIAALLFILKALFIPALQLKYIILITVFMAIFIVIYYAYTTKSFKIFTVYLFLLGSLLYINSVDFVFNNMLKPHQRTRFELLLGLKSDPHGSGYNLNQSLISIGSGGLTGKGYMQGTQTKFKFVPAQSTDFIFCTVGEEWGFIGSVVVIGLYLFLLLRIIFLAEQQRSTFARVYGYSVASILFIHFFINIGMTIGIMPVIGIPLPFFSYGGSSLLSFTILLFIFLKLDATRSEYPA